MVSQMIIPIANRHIEGDSAKELFQIRVYVSLGAAMMQKFCDVEITGALASIFSQHRHGRRVEQTASTRSVETLDAERVERTAEVILSSRRHVDAHALSKGVNE